MSRNGIYIQVKPVRLIGSRSASTMYLVVARSHTVPTTLDTKCSERPFPAKNLLQNAQIRRSLQAQYTRRHAGSCSLKVGNVAKPGYRQYVAPRNGSALSPTTCRLMPMVRAESSAARQGKPALPEPATASGEPGFTLAPRMTAPTIVSRPPPIRAERSSGKSQSIFAMAFPRTRLPGGHVRRSVERAIVDC